MQAAAGPVPIRQKFCCDGSSIRTIAPAPLNCLVSAEPSISRWSQQGGWCCYQRALPRLRHASSSQASPDGSDQASTSGAAPRPAEPIQSFPVPSTHQPALEQPAPTSSLPGDTATTSTASTASTASTSSQDGSATDGKKKWNLVDLLPPAAAVHMLSQSVELLRSNFWPVVLLYMVKDGAAFLLHRFSQRLTNTVSDALLGTNICAAANPWWLYLESSFLESHIGYQLCIVLFFLLALPLNILLSSTAASATAMLAVQPKQLTPAAAAAAAAAGVGTDTAASTAEAAQATAAQAGPTPTAPQQQGNGDGRAASGAAASTSGAKGAAGSNGSATAAAAGEKRPGLMASLRQAVRDVRGVMPEVTGQLKRVWWVDCLFNMRALPLQALSLLVLPLPWTVPRLLSVQLAVHAAILEGHAGKAALDRSTKLMSASKELMAAYGWPFVALIIMVRLLDGARNLTLASIPVRWWQDVVEVPLAVTAAFGFAKLLIIRLQDLLPLAAYLLALKREQGVATEEMRGKLTLPSPPTSVPTI